MGTKRMTRVNELLRREIACSLYHVMTGHSVDLSAVTVTRTETASDLRNARVFVSVTGNEEARKNIISELQKVRPEIQSWINSKLRLKYTPRLTFKLDASIRKGDAILELLRNIDLEEDKDDE
ncbi:MAG: 30S ribosome-binding factor RbfA [Kiritimatiellia bacterium]